MLFSLYCVYKFLKCVNIIAFFFIVSFVDQQNEATKKNLNKNLYSWETLRNDFKFNISWNNKHSNKSFVAQLLTNLDWYPEKSLVKIWAINDALFSFWAFSLYFFFVENWVKLRKKDLTYHQCIRIFAQNRFWGKSSKCNR